LAHEVLQQNGKVRVVAGLASVSHDVGKVAHVQEAVDDLFWGVPLNVDRQRHLGVQLYDQVPESLGALQLVLLEPLLQHGEAVLGHHRTSQLHGLDGVELALF